MRFGSTWRKRQDGIKAIQSLDGALFIDTKDRGMGRRVQVEANDVRRLGFKVWVIADHMVTQAMRLQPVAAPYSGHRHVAGAQLLCQTPAAPLCGAITGSTSRPLQDASFQLVGIFGYRSALMQGNQTAQTLRTKPAGPPLNIRGAARQMRGRLPQTPSASQFQYNSRPLGILCPSTTRSHPSLKFHPFRICKNQLFAGHS